jgi:formylglycine-generating enzyme required for sulfatase activity
MKYLQRPYKNKVIIFFLCLLLITVNLPSAPQNNQLEGLFYWAKKYYLEGMYRESVRKLQALLQYTKKEDSVLIGKVHLLLGAAYEKMGKFDIAKKNYYISIRDEARPIIDEIDFTELIEYQRIILKNKNASIENMIEKERVKPKKRKKSPLLIIAGIAALTALIIFFIKGYNKEEDDNDDLPAERPVEMVSGYDVDTLGIEWVRIPAGQFYMGDNFDEGGADEQPVHLVALDEFYISKYEITFQQYDTFCRETGHEYPPTIGWGPGWVRADRPVYNVTWNDAMDFCTWLTRKTGESINLPTEAQWEYAARGTDQRRYPWGNTEPNCDLANHDCNIYGGSAVVGSNFGLSPFGLYDMAGNVNEWCKDYYDPFYYSYSPPQNPQGPTDFRNSNRVIRGGSWQVDPSLSIRSADRYGVNNLSKTTHIGFRIVKKIQ